jgi:hypothetical protein
MDRGDALRYSPLLRRVGVPCIAALWSCPSENLTNRLSNKIVGAQYHWLACLGFLFREFSRCSLFDYFAQPHKLIHTLIWFYAEPTFKIVHRRGTDRAQNYIALIEHRELNDRPIEVVILDLTLL